MQAGHPASLGFASRVTIVPTGSGFGDAVGETDATHVPHCETEIARDVGDELWPSESVAVKLT